MSTGAILIVPVNKRTKANEERVRQRVLEDQCVACDNPDKKPRRRGLCTTCEGRWTRSRVRLSKKQQAEFDSKLITKGLLLGDGEAQRIKAEAADPFISVAFELED